MYILYYCTSNYDLSMDFLSWFFRLRFKRTIFPMFRVSKNKLCIFFVCHLYIPIKTKKIRTIKPYPETSKWNKHTKCETTDSSRRRDWKNYKLEV